MVFAHHLKSSVGEDQFLPFANRDGALARSVALVSLLVGFFLVFRAGEKTSSKDLDVEPTRILYAARSMLTAAANPREDHQIRRRIKPFLRRTAGCFRCHFGGPAQVLDPRKVPQMLQANAGESGDFFFCKDLLAEPDRRAAHV